MRTPRRGIATRVLQALSGREIQSSVALVVPTEQVLRRAVASKGDEKVWLTIVQPFTLSVVTLTRKGGVRVSGEAKVVPLEVSVTELTTRMDGGYSFTAVRYSTYSWERNYNGGTARSQTWVTYEVTVEPDGTASYKQIDSRTKESR